MSIRTLRLPDDLEPLSEMAAEMFQYPDHPEWSVQADEVESIAASKAADAVDLEGRWSQSRMLGYPDVAGAGGRLWSR